MLLKWLKIIRSFRSEVLKILDDKHWATFDTTVRQMTEIS